MIFTLLKQLPLALGRYVVYRMKRLAGLTPKPSPQLGSKHSASGSLHSAFDIGLAERLGQEVPWPASNEPEQSLELQQSALYQLWRKIPGGSKWSQYFAAYEAVFSSIRHDKLKVLEIGVFMGSSIQLWRDYFDHPATTLVGIDIDPDCARFAQPDRGVQVMIGSQIDTAFLSDVVAKYGPFDIVIDDGSHQSAHIIATFNELFLTGLARSGIYLAEDLHTQYWPNFRNSELSFIDIAKQIVELMHSHYRRETDLNTFWKGYEPRPASIAVPLLTTLVQEVRFFDSIVVIKKSPRAHYPQIMLTFDPPVVQAVEALQAQAPAS